MYKYGVISGPNTGKYGPEITPYLDTFHAVVVILIAILQIKEVYLEPSRTSKMNFFLQKQLTVSNH